MKLIIDIPKATYDYWKEHKDEYVLSEAIAQSIPYNPTGDCISREALKEYVKQVEDYESAYTICAYIDNAPTVEITEKQAIDKLHETGWLIEHDKEMTTRPQSEWVEKEDTPASVYYCCSNCEMESIPVTPYCPWCGAKMKGGAE